MQYYEHIDPEDKDILPISRLGHIERYKLATKLITPGSTVLDAACGYGYGTEMLSKKASHAIGIDRDGVINICKERYKTYQNLHFLVNDVRELGFKDSSIDSVVGMEMIEHIENPESFVNEANRVLKPNGSLLISTPNGNNTLLPDGTAYNPHHITEYTKNQMEEMLNNSGFDILQTYGQYILIGSLMKPSNFEKSMAKGAKSLLEKTPYFSEIFSKHYPILQTTSRNMFYHAVKSI